MSLLFKTSRSSFSGKGQGLLGPQSHQNPRSTHWESGTLVCSHVFTAKTPHSAPGTRLGSLHALSAPLRLKTPHHRNGNCSDSHFIEEETKVQKDSLMKVTKLVNDKVKADNRFVNLTAYAGRQSFAQPCAASQGRWVSWPIWIATLSLHETKVSYNLQARNGSCPVWVLANGSRWQEGGLPPSNNPGTS